MAKTAERKAYDELLKKHYPSGRARGKPISNEVEKQIRAALAKAEASEAITPRPNPRSAVARNAKVVPKSAPLDKLRRGLDTPELNKARQDTLDRHLKKIAEQEKAALAKTMRTDKENRNINRALEQPLSQKMISARKPAVKVKESNGEIRVVSSTAVSPAAKKALKQELNENPRFGVKAGTAAIKSFFKDTLGIKKDIEVDYTFPGDEGYGTPPEDRQSRKSGGKVTAKRPTAKKYAMNRGGVASVRKPTRA